jgi:hypothetical protein
VGTGESYVVLSRIPNRTKLRTTMYKMRVVANAAPFARLKRSIKTAYHVHITGCNICGYREDASSTSKQHNFTGCYRKREDFLS